MLHGHTLEEVELHNYLQMFVLMVLTITKKTVNRVDVLFVRKNARYQCSKCQVRLHYDKGTECSILYHTKDK